MLRWCVCWIHSSTARSFNSITWTIYEEPNVFLHISYYFVAHSMRLKSRRIWNGQILLDSLKLATEPVVFRIFILYVMPPAEKQLSMKIRTDSNSICAMFFFFIQRTVSIYEKMKEIMLYLDPDISIPIPIVLKFLSDRNKKLNKEEVRKEKIN